MPNQNLTTADIEAWLARHAAALAAGVNVGQLDRDKAQAFRLELSHRALLADLRAAGHNVEKWADDPYLLRAYARAVEFSRKG